MIPQRSRNVKPNQDIEHLRLLSIFHYVMGGMLAIFSMFPIIHLSMGIAMVAGAFDQIEKGEAPPAFIGWFIILFAAFFILCGLTLATCVAMAGQRLAHKRNYMYCLVMAGIECMFTPLGTILGVFTIIVLIRPTVKELFDAAQEAEPEQPDASHAG